MKKTFVTILSVLYLVSAIGFGSVQHFCQHMHENSLPAWGECCSVEPVTELSLFPQLAAGAMSCRVAMDARLPIEYDETRLGIKCCDIQHVYNQVDSSTLPLNLDTSQVAEQSSGDFFSYPQRPQSVDGYALTACADPSTQLNFPLLI